MLKPVNYPIIVLSMLLIMGHTRSPLFKSGYNVIKQPPHIISRHERHFLKNENSGKYKLWQLNTSSLSENAFNYAMKGFRYLNKANLITKKNIVSIIDFSKPSTQKRLYVIDVSSGKILFNTWVAHGHNSGNEYASQFSNSPESHQSSLGFYITLGTYTGGHGYSLRLKGCEKGINDNAYERAIVVHGADYVGNGFINSRGVPGRSYGCPAIPNEISKEIIDVIKGGSCLFLYHPTKKYRSRSKILNSQV